MPLYRVYENLIVEGDDMVYFTQERIRWRWSKGARVTVNGEVRYYVEGRKLHVLDDSGKEHVIEIVKQIKKEMPVSEASQPRPPALPALAAPSEPATLVEKARLQVSSLPDSADIEIDGSFVGNTPSDVQVSEGDHTITVKKAGFKDWERKMKVTAGSSVHLNAELEKAAAQ
jgi:hypothetical protein